ncbi:MAG TPA: peptide chain release factor-like protein [Atribacterota bacterium]|nr:peptide chain release factor-like protein [Atribacterota bacterium]
MSEIKDKLLEKINYLEKNRDVILERLVSIGECSYYEKFKKDCGIKISILDRLIELGKQYRDKDLFEKNQKDENGFEDKAYEILNSLDPNDSRDVIIEISSFEENKESEDFMNDLIVMYQKYSEQKKWKHTLISSESTKKGFLKQAIFDVKGESIFRHLKYEAGFHDAITNSDSKGNNFKEISVFIKVYPVIEEKELRWRPEDLKIETFHSSSHGGQSVNTSDSAVRITHLSSGISVSSQNERSQYQNKENALRILRARIVLAEEERLLELKSSERKLMLTNHLNKNKIRTYDFKKNKILDHRLEKTFNDLKHILKGNIDEIIIALMELDEIRKLNYILEL